MSEQKIVTELKVSGHLMKLDPGLYCVFQGSNGHRSNPATGLPGVRISLPPGANGGVEISGFREDGWVSIGNDAVLIRISGASAQVLVTVYQSPLGGDPQPQLQVVHLGNGEPNGATAAPALTPEQQHEAGRPTEAIRPNGDAHRESPSRGAPPAADPGTISPRVTAHLQRRGDVGGQIGEWVGERGSKLWIEGFSVVPPSELEPENLEYQAVLGRGWLSPWSQGGQFCGSRRMALPILGLRVRLRGAAADSFECAYSASFTDGSAVGPVAAGEPCEVGQPGAVGGVPGDVAAEKSGRPAGCGALAAPVGAAGTRGAEAEESGAEQNADAAFVARSQQAPRQEPGGPAETQLVMIYPQPCMDRRRKPG